MKHSLLLCLTFAAIIVNSCKTENQNNLETIFCNTEHADSTMGQYIENVYVLVLETGDNVIRNADKISFLNEKSTLAISWNSSPAIFRGNRSEGI